MDNPHCDLPMWWWFFMIPEWNWPTDDAKAMQWFAQCQLRGVDDNEFWPC